jgi:hypothetical protein
VVSDKKIFKISGMVIYKIFVFGADLKSNMAARVHNVFSLAEILKIFLSETTKSIEFSNLFCGFRKKDENVKFP